MATVPIIHEFTTSCACIGDSIVRRPDRARERWEKYCSQSILGCGMHALLLSMSGQSPLARRKFKGMVRATGRVIDLGVKIPVLHEIGTCGRFLGDRFAGDAEGALENWQIYTQQSILGSTVLWLHAAVARDWDHAGRQFRGLKQAWVKALFQTLAIGAVVAAGGSPTLLRAGP
ncbi:unnamed protein product, partial [Heterosigma akashiwo]